MKRPISTAACLLFLSGAAFAQGTVKWDSISAGSMTVQTNSTQWLGGGSTGGGTIGNTFNLGVAPNGYRFELLYAPFTGVQAHPPTSIAELMTWSDTGLGAISTSAGFGRIQPLPLQASTAATVPWSAGITNSIMMVGWSGNWGTSWSTVFAEILNPVALGPSGGYYLGFSATGYIAPRNSDPGVMLFGSSPTSDGLPIYSPNTQLYIVPLDIFVPEPSTLALVGLSSVTLLFFRPQKK
jgi:hypothetical protein